jgi:hypothetical protein
MTALVSSRSLFREGVSQTVLRQGLPAVRIVSCEAVSGVATQSFVAPVQQFLNDLVTYFALPFSMVGTWEWKM